jgi:hypothetical protein
MVKPEDEVSGACVPVHYTVIANSCSFFNILGKK